jgi:hypothetical protein
VNVIITDRATRETVARYEIHLAGDASPPPDGEYFDGAWEQAVADGLVEAGRRDASGFELQRPKTLYESST